MELLLTMTFKNNVVAYYMNTEDRFIKYKKFLNLIIQSNETNNIITFQNFIITYRKLNKK